MIWISNSPQPVSETSNGGNSIAIVPVINDQSQKGRGRQGRLGRTPNRVHIGLMELELHLFDKMRNVPIPWAFDHDRPFVRVIGG